MIKHIFVIIVAVVPILVGVKYGVAMGGLAIFSFGAAYLLYNLDKFSKFKAGIGGIEAVWSGRSKLNR